MTRAFAAALFAAPLLGGCVAAIPAIAGSAIVKGSLDRKKAAARTQAAPKPAPAAAAAVLPPPSGLPVSDSRQFLFGSAESAGLSLQAYGVLTRYLESIRYRRPETLTQLVMADGSTLAAPMFERCGVKPLAVVLDIDETALLNAGYEGYSSRTGAAFDPTRWERWELTGADKVLAVPGAVAATEAARKAGIAVIFNSNRTAANAKATEAALRFAGLGPVEHQKNLWLKGDDGGGSAKDTRRWAIAGGYCVVALVGDQLGDFSDLFNDPALGPVERRAAAQSKPFAALWGDGWFLLPNPVYGPQLKGGQDEVFPAETRWTDTQEKK